MPRPVQIALSLLLLLALPSCSVTHILLAVVRDGAVHFVARNEKTGRSPICLFNLEVIDENRNVMWSIAASRTGEAGVACVTQSFPLVYGRAPSGTDTLVAPRPLDDGRLYVIRGSISSVDRMGPSWGGAFHYRAEPPTVRNIEYGSREHVRLIKRISPSTR